jgi:hypothetical protein
MSPLRQAAERALGRIWLGACIDVRREKRSTAEGGDGEEKAQERQGKADQALSSYKRLAHRHSALAMGAADVCTTLTAGRRRVSARIRKQVYAAYGLGFPQPRRAFQLDHLIPLELGGSNDVANLWPEPTATAHKKDIVQNELRRRVCTEGGMSLAEAQRIVATD